MSCAGIGGPYALRMQTVRMQPFERRVLTGGEVALGQSVFGDEIGWPGVRVLQAPRLGFGAMVPWGRTIVFSRWSAAYDFSEAAIAEQGWFVHELMHVWQAARGVLLAGAKLGAIGAKAYVYTPHNKRLDQYNIERQAEIARHLFLARIGAPEEGAPDRRWLEDIWMTR